jgi:pSer/pThr/pTyr-binding forkhead associated (FHA) protein
LPGKVLILNAIGVALQYCLVAVIYYFLFQVLRLAYREYRTTKDRAEDEPTVAVVEAQQAKLVTVETGKVQLDRPVYILDETISIGRGEDNEIVINDNFVSHEHACITRYKQGYLLQDLNSTNGTYLNNQRVTTDVLLTNGDLITVGSVIFRFER